MSYELTNDRSAVVLSRMDDMRSDDDLRRDRTILDLTETSHAIAKSKGWWDNSDGTNEHEFPTLLMLVVSEMAEALEEYRMGRGLNEIYFNDKGKPLGVPIEMADAMIRIFDMAGGNGIDLLCAINIKEAYNRHRPHRHGGKVV